MAPNIKDVTFSNGIVQEDKPVDSITTKRPRSVIVWRNVVLFVLLHSSALLGVYLCFTTAMWSTILFGEY